MSTIFRTCAVNRISYLILIVAALLATLFRSASSFSFQSPSDSEMLLYRIVIGCLVAISLVFYFLLAKYAIFAMLWSGMLAVAHYATGIGRIIIVRCVRFFLAKLESKCSIVGSADKQAPRLTAGSLAIFFSPKHWPYRLYPLSCTLLE